MDAGAGGIFLEGLGFEEGTAKEIVVVKVKCGIMSFATSCSWWWWGGALFSRESLIYLIVFS